MRIPNYDIKLYEWLNTVIGKPYIWGETDCGTLVREGLKLITGIDPFGNLPYWKTEMECRQIWDAMGGVDKAFTEIFKFKKIDRNYIQMGDVSVLEVRDLITASLIINNERMLFSSVDKGVEIRNLTQLQKLNIRFYRL